MYLRISLIFFSVIILGCQKATELNFKDHTKNESSQSSAESMTLLQTQCAACHLAKKDGNFNSINDLNQMIKEGRIVPGNPDESRLFVVMNTGFMPPNNRMKEEHLSQLRRWIAEMDPYLGSEGLKYNEIKTTLLEPKCMNCHGPTGSPKLTTYENVMRYVIKGEPQISLLHETISTGAPSPHNILKADEILKIWNWISGGAKE